MFHILEGTLSIKYKEQTYSIPINVHISSAYPSNPDNGSIVLIVVPTSNMALNPNCPFIDRNGTFKYISSPFHKNDENNFITYIIEDAVSKFSTISPVYSESSPSNPPIVPEIEEADSVPCTSHERLLAECQEDTIKNKLETLKISPSSEEQGARYYFVQLSN